MSEIKYYCLDLETNGLVHAKNWHEITEFSIIRDADRSQLSRQVRVDKIENSSIDALRITGKTMEDLKQGISKKQLVEEAEFFINEDGATPEQRCLVGHNIINFDRKFLWQQWENFGKKFPINLFLDTMTLSRAYAKKIGMVKPKVNLEASCDMLGITKRAGKHNAKSDSQNTYLLWLKLMKEIDYLEHIKRMPHGDDGEGDA